MNKKGYSRAIKSQPYRYYEKEIMEKLKDKLYHDKITFQDFVTCAINDYLNGDFIPKKEDEKNK